VKIFSYDTTSSEVYVSRSPDKLKLSHCNGYITIAYDDKWWLGYVMQKNEEDDEVKVTCLHPHGPSPSFSYPSKPDVLWVHVTDVLCVVSPVTPTGRMYVLPEYDISQSNEALSNNT